MDTNQNELQVAVAAYRDAQKTCRTARACFDRARKAVGGNSKLADEAMQIVTDGNVTLNDLRWSSFKGGIGH